MRQDFKNQLERMLCQLCIGVLHSLLREEISIREAEQIIFSPFTSEYLKENKIADDLIDIIHQGCELEDIKNLLPKKFNDIINQLINQSYDLLKRLPGINYQSPTWYSLLDLDKDCSDL